MSLFVDVPLLLSSDICVEMQLQLLETLIFEPPKEKWGSVLLLLLLKNRANDEDNDD